jgi:hypothetical protein
MPRTAKCEHKLVGKRVIDRDGAIKAHSTSVLAV